MVEKSREANLNLNTRSKIMGRIRSALKVKAPLCASLQHELVFEPMAEEDRLARFENEFRALKGEFHQATNWEDAQSMVAKIVKHHSFQRISAAPDPEVRLAVAKINCTHPQTPQDFGSNFQSSDLSITPCSWLVASTGSIVLTPKSGFGRAISVLPHAHMVIARRNQLLPHLKDAYAELRKEFHSTPWPSILTFITGPSRTADIEKILVLGAHGPKKLILLLLDF